MSSKFGKIDYDKLRNYRPGGGSSGDLWLKMRPTETGDPQRYTVRLVVGPDGVPLVDTDIHYFKNIADGSVTAGQCPRKAERPADCPACAMWFELSTLVDEADRKVLEKLRPQTRVFANVVLRAVGTTEVPDSQQRVQIWSMPWRVGMLLTEELQANAEEGVFLEDPENGRDLVVKVIKKGAIRSMVDSISIKPHPSPLNLDEDATPHDLKSHAAQRVFTTEDVENMLPGVLGEEYFAKFFGGVMSDTESTGNDDLPF